MFQQAKQQGIKVMLSGQGADKFLMGYVLHRYLAGLLKRGQFKRLLNISNGMHERRLDDIARFLPSLLHYEDRNSMAFSIRVRTPFLSRYC